MPPSLSALKGRPSAAAARLQAIDQRARFLADALRRSRALQFPSAWQDHMPWPPDCPTACRPGRPGPAAQSCSMIARGPPKAASGMPPPMTLPSTVRSGLMPSTPCAPCRPTRKPVITSSKISRAPCCVQSSRQRWRTRAWRARSSCCRRWLRSSGSLLTIHIALIGYQLLFGRGGMRVTELPFAALKIGLILAFLTSWAAYQTLIFNLLFDGPAEIMKMPGRPACSARLDVQWRRHGRGAESVRGFERRRGRLWRHGEPDGEPVAGRADAWLRPTVAGLHRAAAADAGPDHRRKDRARLPARDRPDLHRHAAVRPDARPVRRLDAGDILVSPWRRWP